MKAYRCKVCGYNRGALKAGIVAAIVILALTLLIFAGAVFYVLAR